MNKLEKIIYDYLVTAGYKLYPFEQKLIARELDELISKHITEELMKILGVEK